MVNLGIKFSEDDKIYNIRILTYYCKLFADKYPHVDIDYILAHAGINKDALEDPFEWVSHNQVGLFFEGISKYFDKPYEIAREAGRYICKDIEIGLFKQFSLKLLGVGQIYRRISKYYPHLTKVSTYSSHKIANNKYEVTVKFNPCITEWPHQEYNRLGILEAGPLLFSNNLANIKSRKEDNGNTIIYTISWDKPISERLKQYRLISLLVCILFFILSFLTKNILLISHVIFITIITYIVMDRFVLKYKHEELSRFHMIHEESADKIIKKYSEDYEHVTILNNIGKQLLKSKSINASLNKISETLKILKYNKIAFFIYDFASENIILKHNSGYDENPAEFYNRHIAQNQSPLADTIQIIHNLDEAKNLFYSETIEVLRTSYFPTVFGHKTKFLGFDNPNTFIIGDINAIITVLINLFNNSCKYTPEPGTILLIYNFNASGNSISVIDNGIGISKTDQDKVFIKFYQASENIHKSIGGFGLGLNIARDIINIHNGDISIVSPVPKGVYDIELNDKRPGTCVTVHFPKVI